VWQDFMFACSTYPTFDPPFMRSVRAEAEDNVRRLRHHACLALWCGNNELEQGLVGDRWTAATMSWRDYKRLFDSLLPRVVRSLDPGRDYWPCSPHSPRGDRCDFNNPAWGDAHLWSVWHGRQPFEWYRTCTHRFNSEFGFQSFPGPKTVRACTAPADRNVTSRVVELHQRSGIGNSTILQYLLDWFRLPPSFEMTLWLSQILQGMAMKYAVEHWRRAMPRGMGTLYWQINDCWPAASWASIDFSGRWKALHYMARRFYAPVLLSGVENPEYGTVDVWITSDRLQPLALTLAWAVTTLRGTVVARGGQAVRVEPQSSRRVRTLKLGALLRRHGPRNLLVWLDLLGRDRTRLSSDLVLFARPKHLELPEPEVRLRAEPGTAGTCRLRVQAKRPALWTWLDVPRAEVAFSDNFFHLRPGQTRTLEIRPGRPMAASDLLKLVKARSLLDTYRP
jgi:beta-mannosidase